jgi:hypothetical protein
MQRNRYYGNNVEEGAGNPEWIVELTNPCRRKGPWLPPEKFPAGLIDGRVAVKPGQMRRIDLVLPYEKRGVQDTQKQRYAREQLRVRRKPQLATEDGSQMA